MNSSRKISGKLLSKNGEVDEKALDQTKLILYYFSASWCGPCKNFTPILIENYQKWNANGKVVEIVFIPWDKKEDEFNAYYEKMPWLAVPFKDDRIEELNDKFDAQGIPYLILVDSNENLLSDMAANEVKSNGEKCPEHWSKLLK
jgi:nucleoredoxin